MDSAQPSPERPARRPGRSRLDAAKARARRAKTALVAVAVAAFALMGVAVRAAHPGASSSGGTSATHLSPPSDLVAALNQGGDDGQFGSGSIAPAQGTPQASTSTS